MNIKIEKGVTNKYHHLYIDGIFVKCDYPSNIKKKVNRILDVYKEFNTMEIEVRL